MLMPTMMVVAVVMVMAFFTLMMMLMRRQITVALRRIIVPAFRQQPGALQIVRLQHRACRTISQHFPRQEQCIWAKSFRRRQIMQHEQHSSPLAPPLLQQRQQISHSPAINRGKRLIQQDQSRILHNNPRKKNTLKLPD
jgi:hypothetical protein